MGRRRAWRGRLAVVGVAGLLVLAGCGDDEEPAEEATGGDTTATEAGGQPAATVEVVERDFEIVPPNATVEEDGLIEFQVTNEGEAPHALEIESDPEVESETIEAGQSTSFTAELDKGKYTWYCPVANHQQLGMEGSLTVGAGGASGGGETETETETESEDESSGAGSSPY